MKVNDFINKYKLKNKATSNRKKLQILDSIRLDNVGMYLRDGPFSSDIGIVNLHPSKETHWVVYNNENFYDSYGCVCLKKPSKILIKRNGHCLYSEYKIQGLTIKRDSYCES